MVHRSIVKKFFIVISCVLFLCVPASPVLAQHVTTGTGGGVVHTSSPPTVHVSIPPAPIIHGPIVPTPMNHAPVNRAPIFPARMPLVSSAGGGFGSGFRSPRRPIRPFPPVLVIYEFPMFFGSSANLCWWATCDLFWPGTVDYTTVSSPGPTNYVSQVYENPVVYGEERVDLPQLFLKDGTILSVTDYWLVDDHLHFTMIESEGAKPGEHVIPFEALDLQTTVDANTRRGFRFMFRNEPFEQYVRDHPEGPTPVVAPPHE